MSFSIKILFNQNFIYKLETFIEIINGKFKNFIKWELYK